MSFCEGLVLTVLPCRAHLRVALIHEHAVYALWVDATRVLIGRFTVTAWDFRKVGSYDLHLSYWPVYLRDRDQFVILVISVKCSQSEEHKHRLCEAKGTLMCLYGGGFLSFFLSSWSCLISFSACSSLNRSAASVRAKRIIKTLLLTLFNKV